MKILLLLSLLILSGCRAEGTPQAQPQVQQNSILHDNGYYSVEVIHDKDRNVTCYILYGVNGRGGIYCFPDYMLNPPIKEIKKASSTTGTDEVEVYKFLQNSRKP